MVGAARARGAACAAIANRMKNRRTRGLRRRARAGFYSDAPRQFLVPPTLDLEGTPVAPAVIPVCGGHYAAQGITRVAHHGGARSGGAGADRLFGQNKVRYRTFKFQVLKTEHFDIYYYPEEEASARMAARMAERWYARLSGILTHELRGRQVSCSMAAARSSGRPTSSRGTSARGRAASPKPTSAVSSCRLPGRSSDRPRPRARASPRLPVRHHQHQRDQRRGGQPAASTCRCGSSRAWPNTCRSARRSAHRDVDARSGAARAVPRHRQARQPALLPVSLRAGAVGLHRRPLRRPRGRRVVARLRRP